MMYNPTSTSSVLKELYLDPLGLSFEDLAKALKVPRQRVDPLYVDLDMALRLQKAFGGSAKSWLDMQHNYDLARVQQDLSFLDEVEVLWDGDKISKD